MDGEKMYPGELTDDEEDDPDPAHTVKLENLTC